MDTRLISTKDYQDRKLYDIHRGNVVTFTPLRCCIVRDICIIVKILEETFMTFRFLASGLSFISIFYYHKRLKHTYTVFKNHQKSLILRLITLENAKNLILLSWVGFEPYTYRSRVQIPPKAIKWDFFWHFLNIVTYL